MTNWTEPTSNTTTWTQATKSDPSTNAYKLLIDATHYLLIDATNHLLIQDSAQGTIWTEPVAN